MHVEFMLALVFQTSDCRPLATNTAARPKAFEIVSF